MWKQRLGSRATYGNLIDVFEHAGYKQYAEVVRKVVTGIEPMKTVVPATTVQAGKSMSKQNQGEGKCHITLTIAADH